MVTEGLARRNGLDRFPETCTVPGRGEVLSKTLIA